MQKEARMTKIEDVRNPRIGETYLVKCIRFHVHKTDHIFPVFGELHHDKEIYLQEKHFHVDWRFVSSSMIKEQEDVYIKQYPSWLFGKDVHMFTPLTEKIIKGEPFYQEMVYERHFAELECEQFRDTLEPLYKDIRMEGMICPHKKANLTSCQVIHGVVTCPLHGLRWDVQTGALVPSKPHAHETTCQELGERYI